MNSEKLVSVITPIYNGENYILETINSVINQTYKNWEIIIVDNCSTDNSRQIVESINDPRIKLIKLDYNSGGPARPRNRGLENSKGDYIA
ncbi:MAG: glycosyltransferase family 2 protein, partial [Arcobacteraceae bacterium]|nr:glycosyltransferase family 2 protein [Arcobacteraceae bacterium]